MRKIINGKRYDTETATQVAHYRHSNPGDFAFYAEELYRTRRGNWFLAGEGGPMSAYARSVGQNETAGGSGISPLTSDEARDWLETKGKTLELEKYFGDEIEDA